MYSKICLLLRLTKKKAAIHFQFRNELPLFDDLYYRINYLNQFLTFKNNNFFLMLTEVLSRLFIQSHLNVTVLRLNLYDKLIDY
jgi:hypothetical protein